MNDLHHCICIYRLELTRVNYKRCGLVVVVVVSNSSSNNKQDKIYVHTKYCHLLVDWLVLVVCYVATYLKKRSINNYMLNNQYIYNNFCSSFPSHRLLNT